MKKMMCVFMALVLGVLMVSHVAAAGGKETQGADDYPSKPITIIIPYTPGGQSDIYFRALQPFLSKELGVPIVLESRPGGNTQVGATEFMRRPADGYTFFNANQHSLSATIHSQGAPYKIEDFATITVFENPPQIICVDGKSPYRTLEDMIEAARQKPGSIKMSMSGRGGNTHLFCLWLQKALGVDLNPVPYTNGTEQHAAVLGGHATFTATDYAYVINNGYHPLAIDTDGVDPVMPNIPVLKEILAQKYKTADLSSKPLVSNYRGFVAHAEFKKNYPERWKKFTEAYKRAFDTQDFKDKCKEIHISDIVIFNEPEEAHKITLQFDRDFVAYADLLKE
jgi:tripartite-type tricarboxylate transporter receptor subunit TctC